MLLSITNTGIITNLDVTSALASFIKEKRKIDVVSISEQGLSSKVKEPTEKDIKEYYDENSSEFMNPSTKNISYIYLNPESIKNLQDIKVEKKSGNIPLILFGLIVGIIYVLISNKIKSQRFYRRK